MIQKTVFEKLEHVSIIFLKYHMKILLRDFNVKLGERMF